jgi:hypothetical protein
MLALLHLLGRKVDVVVSPRPSTATRRPHQKSSGAGSGTIS